VRGPINDQRATGGKRQRCAEACVEKSFGGYHSDRRRIDAVCARDFSDGGGEGYRVSKPQQRLRESFE
jgi:hypothetical protein